MWTPERHFHAFGGLYPNPSVTSAAIAAITERIQIRAGSVVLPLHNPIRVAEEWSVVDNLSGGRVGLSFASGWHANDFALLPENYANRREIMLRSIETIRKLWRGEAVLATSGDGSAIDVRILPRPVQASPPIWITAAGNVETFRLAGQLGANLLTNMLGQSAEDLAGKIAAYRAARRESGHRGDGHVSLMLHTFVGADLDVVREKVRGPFIEYLRTSTDLIKQAKWYFPAFKGADKSGSGSSGEGFALSPDDMDALLAHAFERYYETHGLFGTPDSCAEMVFRLKAIGVDEIACLIDFGVAEDDVLQSLEHLNRLRQKSNAEAPSLGDEYGIPAQIRRHGVTHMQCTPSLIRILLEAGEASVALGGLKKLLPGWRGAPSRGRRTLARHLAWRSAQHVRAHRDDRVVHDVAGDRGPTDHRRATYRQYHGAHSRSPRATLAARRGGGASHRRSGRGARIPRPSRAHRGTFHCQHIGCAASVGRAKLALPDRRSRSLPH